MIFLFITLFFVITLFFGGFVYGLYILKKIEKAKSQEESERRHAEEKAKNAMQYNEKA